MATTFLTTQLGLALEAASLVPGAAAVVISHIELGNGRYNAIGDETGLATPFSPRLVYPIISISLEGIRTTIRALIADAAIFEAYEIGIFANGTFNQNGELQSDGTLYAVAAHTTVDGVLLDKSATDIIVFQGSVNYSNEPNFVEGPVLLAPIATESLDGITRRVTQAEAEDSLENSKFMTALRTAQQIAATIAGHVSTAVNTLRATSAQAIAGTLNTVLMTPLRVREAMGDYVADFAKMGSTTDIDDALIPNAITRDAEVENFAKNASTTRLDVAKLPTNVRIQTVQTTEPTQAEINALNNGDILIVRDTVEYMP